CVSHARLVRIACFSRPSAYCAVVCLRARYWLSAGQQSHCHPRGQRLAHLGNLVLRVINFAVWLFGTMYDKSFAGLLQCYTMAIPFFRGTLVSDLVFTPVLFSIPFAVSLLEKERAGASRRIGTP